MSSISYRPTDLSLLKEFSKDDSFSNSYKLPSLSAVQKISMSTITCIEFTHFFYKGALIPSKVLMGPMENGFTITIVLNDGTRKMVKSCTTPRFLVLIDAQWSFGLK